MKFIFPAVLFLSLLILVAPLLLFHGVEAEALEPSPAVANTEMPATPTASSTPAVTGIADSTLQLDAQTTVRLQRESGIVSLSLHDYLVGVVASEMPVSFEPEALKAQAIAARSYTLYRMTVEPVHTAADVCDNVLCCKAYANEEELRAKWGDSYAGNIATIEAAVRATDGYCLSYEGQAILSAFHSSSDGMTESSENVWGRALPYLVSVSTPETDADVPNLHTTVILALDEFRRIVADGYPDAVLDGDPSGWLTNATYSDSGRLLQVDLGGVTLSGTQLRFLLELRSSAITWTFDSQSVTFQVSGYGHGVGMSQYGANVLAEQGLTCTEILAHYYPGTSLQSLAVLTQAAMSA